MNAVTQQPDNLNFLYPQQARFVLKRAPNLTFFTQSISQPGMTLGEWDQNNPFVKIPLPGNQITYEPFTMRFRIDEDMKNYLEIHDWMIKIGFPDDFTQSGFRAPPGGANLVEDNIHSDGTLMIMTSAMNPNIEVTFIDMFPISLAGLEFDTQVTDSLPLDSTVTFSYRKFSLRTV